MKAAHRLLEIHAEDAYYDVRDELIGKRGYWDRKNDCDGWEGGGFTFTDPITVEDAKNGASFYMVKTERLMKYKCPYCDYEMLDGEDEDCGDCGCPSCRRIIDWSDYEEDIN